MTSIASITKSLVEEANNLSAYNKSILIENELLRDEIAVLKAQLEQPNSGNNSCSSKSKKKPNPDAPKRPTSAYMIWLNENRNSIRDEHFPKNEHGDNCYPHGHAKAGEPLKGRFKVTLTTTKAGAIWKELDNESKAPYQAKFEKASAVYREKMCVYKEEMGDYTPIVPKAPAWWCCEIPQAPDGWCGPFEHSYLAGRVKSPDSNNSVKLCRTFEEAVTKAKIMGDLCAGITKTRRGYSIRSGANLRETPEGATDGYASWTKGSTKPIFEKSSKLLKKYIRVKKEIHTEGQEEFHDATDTMQNE